MDRFPLARESRDRVTPTTCRRVRRRFGPRYHTRFQYRGNPFQRLDSQGRLGGSPERPLQGRQRQNGVRPGNRPDRRVHGVRESNQANRVIRPGSCKGEGRRADVAPGFLVSLVRKSGITRVNALFHTDRRWYRRIGSKLRPVGPGVKPSFRAERTGIRSDHPALPTMTHHASLMRDRF